MIRSQGEWLFHEAATSGDWESAAIALRKDVARLAAEKAELVQALEASWTLRSMPLSVEQVWGPMTGDWRPGIWRLAGEEDSLLDFVSEAP